MSSSCGSGSCSSGSCSGCGYSALSSYCGCQTTMAPVPSQVPSMATVVVPVFGGISYNSLTLGGGCSNGCGYVSINDAYETSQCGSYTTRNCGC